MFLILLIFNFVALGLVGYGIFQSIFLSREMGNLFVTTGCFFLLLAVLAASFGF